MFPLLPLSLFSGTEALGWQLGNRGTLVARLGKPQATMLSVPHCLVQLEDASTFSFIYCKGRVTHNGAPM